MTYTTKKELRRQLADMKLCYEALVASDWTAPDREAIAAKTRHETLRTVLEALDIKGYSPYSTPSLFFGATERHYDTDRFLADLQTAIEVRAERKEAERRDATEAKVAGFTKKPEPLIATLIAGGDLDASKVTANDLRVDLNVSAKPDTAKKSKKTDTKKKEDTK